jgi:hypothetical protein
MRRRTNEEFIKEAKLVHGDKYDYSLVKYKNNYTKVKIICKEHGIFEQEPCSHLNGCGCISCVCHKKSTTEEFVIKAKLVHGDRYDYFMVEYVKSSMKIKIICKEHGIFEQTPNSHLNGQGCPSCVGLKKSTTEEFIIKAILIHGDKYDYSLTIYESNKKK